MLKKQIELIVLISVILSAGAWAGIQAGQKIGIDLGPTTTGNWNNITGNGTVGDGSVVALDGSVLTGISITVADGRFFNNDGPNNWVGLTANGGSAPAEFVDSVTTDIAGTYGAGMPPFAITVAGLNNSLSYDVIALCTSVPPYANEETLTINDTVSMSLKRDESRDNGMFHSFTAVATDGNGNLMLKFTNNPENNPVVCGILITAVAMGQASAPQPEAEAEDVLRNKTLNWVPGLYAATHDVYFGTSFDNVNDASTGNALNVLVSPGQDVNAFDPGRLDFGQTYFWRVDEVNGTPDKTVFKGDVWSFTTEPFAIRIPVDVDGVTASSSAAQNPPSMTVNGSGLAGNTHATDSATMWLSATGDLSPWLMYEFDRIQKLDHMLIWNSNTNSEGFIGWGIKDVNIEFSLDGIEWTGLAPSTQISRGPGLPTYSSPQVIDLGLALAKYVRLNILNNWGGLLKQYGVSEVQFYGLPLYARTPDPASGSVNVDPGLTVRWRAGREADQHTLYAGADANAVADGTAPSVSFNTNSADLGVLDLQLGETYAWRVDEVNVAETPSSFAGDVWSFATQAYFVVDDFESYSNVSPQRPFQTWLDGYGYSADEYFPVKFAGNGTGAGVGHDIWNPGSPYFDGTIMEESIVKSGNLSLPFYYNNTGAVASQIDRKWSQPQDWSAHGIQTLVLNVYGARDNTGTSLYVKINDETVTYPESSILSQGVWVQWAIDLSSVNGNLQAVTQLSIGVTGVGTGTLYIDAIRLYPDTPEFFQPTEPDQAGLVAYYALDGNARDTSGHGAHGVENGVPVYEAGVQGQAIRLDGIGDYVDLGVPTHWPSGNAPRTMCAWAQTFSLQPGWRVIVGYGSPVAPQGTGLVMNGTALYGSGYGSDISQNNFWDEGEWHHVGLTYDGTTARLYTDGIEAVSGDLNWNTVITVARIGRQVNEANEFWDGLVDEVRVYDQALSLAEMAWLSGKTAPVLKPF